MRQTTFHFNKVAKLNVLLFRIKFQVSDSQMYTKIARVKKAERQATYASSFLKAATGKAGPDQSQKPCTWASMWVAGTNLHCLPRSSRKLDQTEGPGCDLSFLNSFFSPLRKADSQRCPIHWFTPQRAAIARTRLFWGRSFWVHKPKDLDYSPLPSSATNRELDGKRSSQDRNRHTYGMPVL